MRGREGEGEKERERDRERERERGRLKKGRSIDTFSGNRQTSSRKSSAVYFMVWCSGHGIW
jgi:hypothetical protein